MRWTEISNAASTQKGFSLPQVAELSKKVGLNYQMAFRSSKSEIRDQKSEIEQRGDFIVPSVVHWKVGHYAAMVRQEGDRYLLEDPTFGNTVWATRQALEAETSGYFLIPPGELPPAGEALTSRKAHPSGERATTAGQRSDNSRRTIPEPESLSRAETAAAWPFPASISWLSV